MDEFMLPDVPDLSGLEGDTGEPFADGWYQATILPEREFETRAGSLVRYVTEDVPARREGAGRNIRLQLEITRKADRRRLFLSMIVNYHPEDLTEAMVQAVAQQRDYMRQTGESSWGDLLRPFLALNKLARLQRIAGVSRFRRTPDGGLDLEPLFDKTLYVRLGPDDRNPRFKAVVDFRDSPPARTTVL